MDDSQKLLIFTPAILTQPDLFDINAATAIGIKSSENPSQLLLSTVQHTNVVCLNKNLTSKWKIAEITNDYWEHYLDVPDSN